MLMTKRILLFSEILTLFIALESCNSKHQSTPSQASQAKVEDQLIFANKQAVIEESRQIDSLLKIKKWNLQVTGSGLRYKIFPSGKKSLAHVGMTAQIDFTTMLLNGDTAYSSVTDGPKEFTIGKGNVESGLEEGILLMHKGDNAIFVLPSHLAYGLAGDLNKIPPKATLIYYVKLLELK
jgi:FKBP-type peptidyl-prolyl cis-trans isomerase FkpA